MVVMVVMVVMVAIVMVKSHTQKQWENWYNFALKSKAPDLLNEQIINDINKLFKIKRTKST